MQICGIRGLLSGRWATRVTIQKGRRLWDVQNGAVINLSNPGLCTADGPSPDWSAVTQSITL